MGLIFLSSIFSDISVIWLRKSCLTSVGNVYLIWPVVSHKFEAHIDAGLQTVYSKFSEVKIKVIAMIPKFSDLQKED